MIETIKKEIRAIEEGIEYMELADTAWTPAYTKLRKTKRILAKTLKKLERLEGRKNV
jgi:hypothetical protein